MSWSAPRAQPRPTAWLSNIAEQALQPLLDDKRATALAVGVSRPQAVL
ncbi:MAG: hypothetical protein G5703_11200 [Serratia symbiotica]|nr:hypothetical protein [Serratia symbiotica]